MLPDILKKIYLFKLSNFSLHFFTFVNTTIIHGFFDWVLQLKNTKHVNVRKKPPCQSRQVDLDLLM